MKIRNIAIAAVILPLLMLGAAGIAEAESVWQCSGDPDGCLFHWTSTSACDIDYTVTGGGSTCDEWIFVANELNNNGCCGGTDPWGCADKGNGSCLTSTNSCTVSDWTEAADDTCDCVLVDSWANCNP